MDLNFEKLSFINYIKKEYKQENSFFTLPFMATMNYFTYKKWSKLYFDIQNNDNIIHLNCNIRVFMEEAFFELSSRLKIFSDKAHIIQTKNYLYFFPFGKRGLIFQLEEPFKILLNKHNTIINHTSILTVKHFKKIEFEEDKTKFYIKTPRYNEKIKLIVYKKLTL